MKWSRRGRKKGNKENKGRKTVTERKFEANKSSWKEIKISEKLSRKKGSTMIETNQIEIKVGAI